MTKKEHTIVILHGWGLYGDKYSELKKELEKKGYTVYSPDFPGFGTEVSKKKSMNLSDFTDFFINYLDTKRIKKMVIIGHSFGGRVAIHYASTHSQFVELLILTGVPIIHHYGLKQKVSFIAAKTLKIPFLILPDEYSNLFRKLLYKIIGEYDYFKSGNKRSTFKNIIGESLTSYFQKITAPIVLIWGELDRLTPAGDVVKISQINNVRHSKLVEGFGHSLPYQAPKEFADIVDSYIVKYA
jgi:pimeloyl-ACP methyl ester carboxylesterase